MVESPSLEVFKKHLDIVMRDMVYWEILVIGRQLDWMILEVFSNLGDSMILILRASASWLHHVGCLDVDCSPSPTEVPSLCSEQ